MIRRQRPGEGSGAGGPSGGRRQRGRGRGAAVPLLLGLTAAVGAGTLSIHRRGPGPDALAPAVSLDPVPGLGWDLPWSRFAVPPDAWRGAALEELFDVALALGIVVVGLGCLTAGISLLAGIRARRSESALREAIGATPGRLRREFLRRILATVIPASAAGAVLGLLAGRVALAAWPHLAVPGGFWLALAGAVPPVLVAGGAALSVAAGGVGSLARRVGDGGRSTPATRGFGDLFAEAQVGISIAFLVAAAALASGHPVPPGAEAPAAPVSVLLYEIDAGAQPGNEGERARLYEEVLARIGSLPSVEAESVATAGAALGIGTDDIVLVHCGRCFMGSMPVPIQAVRARHQSVTPGFFRTMGARVLLGRGLDVGDRIGTPPVAVVNRALAGSFEDGNPLGRDLVVGGPGGIGFRVVGVVEDIRAPGIGQGRNPPPTVYLAAFQHPPRHAELLVRTAGLDPLEPAVAPGGVVSAVPPMVTVSPASTLAERTAREATPLVWMAGLFAVLGGLALALSIHGTHTVLRQEAHRRAGELAVRSGVGASPRSLTALILGRAFRQMAIGTAVGAWATVALTAPLRGVAGAVPLFDVPTFGAATLIVGLAGFGAAVPTALRAARVDPLALFRAH